MNPTKVGRSILVFVGILLAGCFPKPSERFECDEDSDCRDGRTCDITLGYCVRNNGSGGSGLDGPGGDAEDPCTNFSSRHFTACALPRPTMPMSLTTAGIYTFNTMDGTLTDPSSGQSIPPSMENNGALVISVESFSLVANGTLRVNGNRPLVIASWGTIEVSGTIDTSSTLVTRGAGANPPTFCAAHLATAGTANNGGGGAGGGSLQSAGGPGGDGGDGAANGGNGGTAAGTAPFISGGCSGANGGTSGGNAGGAGGLGGGAIQLTARVSISIAATGRINAGGAGGRHSTGAEGGGGGGGAGGMIGFEAPSLTVTPGAIIAANGGGGGQGGGNAGGTATPGQDATLAKCTTTACTVAAGGQGGSGGEGGSGSISATAAVTGQIDGAGGGGGGGGAGYITVKAMTRNDTNAMYSPAALILP